MIVLMCDLIHLTGIVSNEQIFIVTEMPGGMLGVGKQCLTLY